MKTTFEGVFNGAPVRADGTVLLKFKTPTTEIGNVAGTLGLSGQVFKIGVQTADGSQIYIGRFTWAGLNIKEGLDAVIQFKTDLAALKIGIPELRALVNASVTVIIDNGTA